MSSIPSSQPSPASSSWPPESQVTQLVPSSRFFLVSLSLQSLGLFLGVHRKPEEPHRSHGRRLLAKFVRQVPIPVACACSASRPASSSRAPASSCSVAVQGLDALAVPAPPCL